MLLEGKLLAFDLGILEDICEHDFGSLTDPMAPAKHLFVVRTAPVGLYQDYVCGVSKRQSARGGANCTDVDFNFAGLTDTEVVAEREDRCISSCFLDELDMVVVLVVL